MMQATCLGSLIAFAGWTMPANTLYVPDCIPKDLNGNLIHFQLHNQQRNRTIQRYILGRRLLHSRAVDRFPPFRPSL